MARQLLETTGGIAAVVNAAAPGKESKGFHEAPTYCAGGFWEVSGEVFWGGGVWSFLGFMRPGCTSEHEGSEDEE